MSENLLQLSLLALGACVIALLSCKRLLLRRAGFALGVLHQPLWLITAWRHGQWGLFLLSVWYTLAYLNGIRNSSGWGARG